MRRDKRDESTTPSAATNAVHPLATPSNQGYKSYLLGGTRRLRASAAGSGRVTQGIVILVLLVFCCLLLAQYASWRRNNVGATARAIHPEGIPSHNSLGRKYTEKDAERSKNTWKESIENRKKREREAMQQDRSLTLLYQKKAAMTPTEFEAALLVAKKEVRAAEDAVANSRATEVERRRIMEKVVRSARETRALQEVEAYLSWAHTVFRGYGKSDVCRHHDHVSEIDDEGSLLVAASGSASTTARTFVKDCVPNSPFLHAKPDLIVDDVSGLTPLDAAVTCELMILGVDICDASMGTYLDCVLWFGTEAWSLALQPQCGSSSFWTRVTQELFRQYGIAATIGVREFRKGGRIASQRTAWKTKNLILDKITKAAVAPNTRPSLADQWGRVEATMYAPPLSCTSTNNASLKNLRVFPFSYGITSSYFSRHVTKRKLLDWNPILPGLKPLTAFVRMPKGTPYRLSYSLSIVDEYLNTLLLRFSKFSWTHIRGGPDSMRHYEILSQGTTPYFLDLDACYHKPCLSNLPHALLKQVTKLPGVSHLSTVNDSESHVETPYYFRFTKAEVSAISLWTYVLNFVAPGDIHADEFDEEEHRKLSIQLLDVSRESLSCASVMKSLFVRSGFAALDSLPRSIIFISFPHTDYITYTVECGLDELGLNYTVNYRFGTAYSDEDDDMMRPTHRNPNFTLTRATGGLLIREVLRRKTIKNYGLGFASAQKLSLPPNPIPASQEALCRQILDGWHDFYIIAWKSDAFLRDSCFEEAMRILGPDRVVIVEGEDQEFLPNMTKYALRGVRIFSRESRCELFE